MHLSSSSLNIIICDWQLLSSICIGLQERQAGTQRHESGDNGRQQHSPVSTVSRQFDGIAAATSIRGCMAPKWCHDGFDSLHSGRGGDRQGEGQQQHGGHEGGQAQRSSSQNNRRGSSKDHSSDYGNGTGSQLASKETEVLTNQNALGSRGGQGRPRRGNRGGRRVEVLFD